MKIPIACSNIRHGCEICIPKAVNFKEAENAAKEALSKALDDAKESARIK